MKYISYIWQTLLFKEKRNTVILLIMMFVAMFLETLGIGLIIPVINLLVDPDSIKEFLLKFNMEFISEFSNIQLAILIMTIICFFYLLKNLYLFYFYWWQVKFATDIRISLSTRIYRYYLHKPYDFYLNQNSSILIRNINNETDNFQNGLISIIILLSEIIVIFGLVGLLFYIEPIPILIAIGVLGSSAILFSWFTQKGITYWSKKRIFHQGEIFKNLMQGFGGFKAIRILNRQQFFYDSFNNHIVNFSFADRWFKTLQQLPRLWLEFVAIFLLTLIVITLLILGKSSESLFIILGVYAATAFRLLPSVNKIIMAIQRLRFVMPAIEIIYGEINNEKKLNKKEYFSEDLKNNNKFDFSQKIHIKDLSFSYASEKKVLENVNLTINKLDSIGIIGESGSGKSTLIDLFMGLLMPNTGSILLDDQDISKNYKGWQKILGYVPQDIYLLDDTIAKNVALGLKESKIQETKLNAAIEAAQLTKLINELPKGVGTLVGERGVRLSGGQRQRIGIARALYTDPEIIILDEATSSLDFETEKNIIAAINKLKGIKTIIIVTHRHSTIDDCDKIYEIADGKIKLK